MFKSSAVTEPPMLDWKQHPDAIAAQAVCDTARAALAAARAHQETLFQQQQAGDELLRYRATLDLPAAQRTIWEKELEAKAAERHLNAVEIQVKPAVEAAWKEQYIPVVSELFDLLVKVASVHTQVEKLQEHPRAMTTATHGQLTKEGVASRISSVCRDLQMSPDRWLPLE